MPDIVEKLIVTSSVFEHEGNIPVKYTCDGEGINPPLHIEAIPEMAKTLAIITEDPDAPKGIFDHWLVWNIDPTDRTIPENSNPGVSGTNSAGKTGYHSPCPPSGSHRYYFNVFALNEHLDLPAGTDKKRYRMQCSHTSLQQGVLWAGLNGISKFFTGYYLLRRRCIKDRKLIYLMYMFTPAQLRYITNSVYKTFIGS